MDSPEFIFSLLHVLSFATQVLRTDVQTREIMLTSMSDTLAKSQEPASSRARELACDWGLHEGDEADSYSDSSSKTAANTLLPIQVRYRTRAHSLSRPTHPPHSTLSYLLPVQAARCAVRGSSQAVHGTRPRRCPPTPSNQ